MPTQPIEVDNSVSEIFALVQKANWKELDKLFVEDLDDIETVIILVRLRVTFAFRVELPHWIEFRNKARIKFLARGLNADRILDGLLNDDDLNTLKASLEAKRKT